MNELRCEKHGIDLECMGGRSAHWSNWYCPKCYAEEEKARIERLCEADEDGWHKIVNVFNGYPPAGRWYDAYTYTREGVRTVRELFYDGLSEDAEHCWLSDGDWNYPVTHWRERPDPPREDR